MSISHVSTVEKWRPLVEKHFPASQVGTTMRILECESGGDPDAKNRGSSAAGLFQFLRGTWDTVAQETGSPSYAAGGVFDPEWSIINAVWLVENVSWRQWSCY